MTTFDIYEKAKYELWKRSVSNQDWWPPGTIPPQDDEDMSRACLVFVTDDMKIKYWVDFLTGELNE